MCRYCAVDGSCIHGEARGTPHTCACSLSGPSRCPECDHDCFPWYSSLQLPEYPDLASVISESEGPVKYPASREDLLRYLASGGANDPSMRTWVEQRLPVGTYRDPGEAIAAMGSPIEWAAAASGPLLHRIPTGAILAGTRVAVHDGQLLALVTAQGTVLDVLKPGTTTVTRENAPRAAAASRPPAPGFSQSVLDVEPVFVSTREVPVRLSAVAPCQDNPAVKVSVRTTVSVEDPGLLIPALRLTGPSVEAGQVASALESQAQAWLRPVLAAHALAEMKSNPSILEAPARSQAQKAGLAVRSWTVEAVEPANAQDLAARRMQQIAAMPNLPPEMAARINAQLAAAGRPPMASGGAVRAPPSTGGADRLPCPSCGAPNPPDGKFCGNCGKPLSVKRLCSSCHEELAPDVKFCGHCGARVT